MTLFVFVTMGISSLSAQTFVDVQEASIRIHKQCEVFSTSLLVLKQNKQGNEYTALRMKYEYYLSLHDAITTLNDVEAGLNTSVIPGSSASLDAQTASTKPELIAFKNEAIALLSI